MTQGSPGLGAQLLLLAGLSLTGGAASAAVLTVTSVGDDPTAGDGLCTLREAILNANGDSDTTGGDCPAGSGADTIVVPPGTYLLSIPGAGEDSAATGDLDITGDLTVVGAGQELTVIDAAGIDHVFHIPEATAAVSLHGLTITGGGLEGTAFGHGILNQGQELTITDSGVSGNEGGGVVNSSSCPSLDCTVLLTRATVSDNCTGIFEVTGGATTTATDSTVSDSRGCGVFSGGIISAGELVVTNSTVTGNFGTGILHFGEDTSLTVTNSTVADNTGPTICSGFPPRISCTDSPDGISSSSSGTVTLRNSIVANPHAHADCEFSLPINSGGYNVDIDGTCGLTEPTDLPNTDPVLGPLQDNSGPTWTHALQLGSPAIDAIASDSCSLTTDQRGVRRPRVGDRAGPALCDIGAYEVTACADGLDNDDDGRIDFDGGVTAGLPAGQLTNPDPQCGSARNLREDRRRRCGLGFDLALLLPALLWAKPPTRRGSRRARLG